MRLRRAKLVALGGAGLLWAFGWLWIGTVALAQGVERKTAKIVDFNFDPGELKVAVGTKITWTNTGQRPHTVTDRGGTFDTGRSARARPARSPSPCPAATRTSAASTRGR
jgi:plastocyanin